MELSVHTIEGTLYSGTVTALVVSTEAGQLTILPGHKPLISATVPGTLRVLTPNETTIELKHRGILEVKPESGGVVMLLRSN